MAVNKHEDGRRWVADFSVKINGKRKRFQETFDSKKLAEDWEHTEPKRIEASLQGIAQAKVGERTIDDIITSFKKSSRWSRLQPLSKKTYEERIALFADWCKGRGIIYAKSFIPDDQNKYDNSEAYYEFLKSRVSSLTANDHLTTISALFRTERARPMSGITSVPTEGVFKDKIIRGEIRWFTPEELDMIHKVLNDYDRHLFDYILVGGLRRGEIINLDWPRVEGDLIRIVPHDGWRPKWGRSRFLPKPDRAYECEEYFRSLLHKKYVISNQKSHGLRPIGGTTLNMRYTLVIKHVEKRFKYLGLRDTSPHTFRATCGSLMLQNGVPMAYVSKWLGHRSVTVTEQHYASLSVDNLVEAAEAMNRAISRQAKQSGDLGGDQKGKSG